MGDINKKNKIHLQVYTNQANYITKFISLTNYIELFDGKKKKKKNNFILWQSIVKDVLTSQGLDINAL